jgi:hypothetical protein
VRIFEDLCGPIMAIFRRIGATTATFSPKKTISRRFRAVHNPLKIHTALQESTRPSQNPHNLLEIRTAG